MRMIFFLSALIALSATPNAAEEQAVFFAHSVENIRIDGDLSDWPQDVPRYAITDARVGDLPRDAQDYEGHVQIAYSTAENALYVALEVRDESIVAYDGDERWQMDGCDIGLDLAPGNDSIDLFEFSIWGTDEVRWSTNKNNKDNDTRSWGLPKQDAQVSYRRGAFGHIYEWRFDAAQIGGGALHLEDGQAIGMTVRIRDQDADGSLTNIVWCAVYTEPLWIADHVRHSVFLGREEAMQWGQIRGQARWADNDEGMGRSTVYARSSEHAGLQIALNTDREGNFSANLPTGTYTLGIPGGGELSIAVSKGEESLDKKFILEKDPVLGTTKPAIGRARKAGEGIHKGNFTAFGVRDGLQQTRIEQTEEDALGQLWMSTRDGLLRYDGQQFTYFAAFAEVPGYVSHIAVEGTDVWIGTFEDGLGYYDGENFKSFTREDGLIAKGTWVLPEKKGQAWIGSQSGLSHYSGSPPRFTNYTSADGLPSDHVTAFIKDEAGTLWVGTARGLSYFDGTAFVPVARSDRPEPYAVNALVFDRDGALWAATDAGLARYDNDQLSFFDRSSHNLPTDQIKNIIAARDGGVWAATDSGLVRYDGQHIKTYTTADGLPTNNISQLKEDSQGQLWLDTGIGYNSSAQGLVRFDGQRFTHYTTEDGLVGDAINHIMEDSHGNIWASSWKGGVTRYNGHRVTNFTQNDGLSSQLVYSVLQDQRGRFWFTTDRGVDYYEDGQFHHIDNVKGLTGITIRDLEEDQQGQIWVGTYGNGLYRFDGQHWAHWNAENSPLGNRIRALLVDRTGRLWVGSNNGLGVWDGQRWSAYTDADGLETNDVIALVEDDNGHIWINYNYLFNGNISRFDGATFTHYNSEKDGTINRNFISSFKDRDGQLWFGTWVSSFGGLSRWDGERFHTLSSEDGLTTVAVPSIYQDARGTLYFGTWGGGINLYDGLVMQTLNQHDGLVNDMVQDIIEDRDGYMWITTEGGVTRYKPSEVAPKIDLSITADRPYASGEKIDIDTNQDFVRFEFLGSSFTTNVDRLVYVYRLRGHDDEWKSTPETSVEYTGLPTGSYTFEVKAVDRDLNYSAPVRTELAVHLPYGRIAAISGLSLSALVIFGLVLRLGKQARSLRRNNEALTATNTNLDEARQQAETAQSAAVAANRAKSLFLANMSHEIRTPMNAILGYAQILRRSAELAPDHRHAVDTIQTSGDHLLRLINDVLDISKIEAGRMELDPDNFDLRQMLESLGVMFALQCQGKGLVWSLTGLDDKALPVYGDEAKLRQVLINLLGNAVKFTNSGSVSLALERLDGDRCRFVIADTGPGMTPEEVESLFRPFQQGAAGHEKGGTGLGLTIAQRQLKLMHSDLEVESTPGQGARFSFTMRLLPARNAVPSAETDGNWSRVQRLAPGTSARVLVADDVVENREILRDMLTHIGVDVEVADNGKEALEKLDTFKPDLVFFDIRMPVMDGREALQEMRGEERWQQIKAVAISASVLEHERQSYLQTGFDDFIDKPFRFEWVCACLARHLNIEYAYEEEVAKDQTPLEEYIDWSGLSLDPQMHTRLQEAAEIYSVTDIEDYLRAIEIQSPAHRKLAEHLRYLKQEQNMDGIIEVLNEVRHG